jgi:hypothetical protein
MDRGMNLVSLVKVALVAGLAALVDAEPTLVGCLERQLVILDGKRRAGG